MDYGRVMDSDSIEKYAGIRPLPCPFCGEKKDIQILNMVDFFGDEWVDSEKRDELIKEMRKTVFVNCPTCGCTSPTVEINTENADHCIVSNIYAHNDLEAAQMVVRQWNRRAK